MNVFDARKLSPQSQEQMRLRVARSVVDEGLRPSQAARLYKVSRTSVFQWAQAYRRRGERGLAGHKRGRPPHSRLAGHQAATAVRLISTCCPNRLGLPFVLWTRQAVQGLLASRFGLKVSIWTAGRYLAHWNLTPQKPLRRAYEQDPKAVRHWLQVEYPRIRARAKREGAEIHWGDEMGLRSDHQTGTSYGRRGRTPVVPGTGQRFSFNLMSTVTNRGTLRFMTFERRFTADVCIEFLGRLLRSVDRKIFLIVDGHPVHRSARVREWVAARPDRIELFELPGYSPELNPDEYLNQDVKSNALGRQRSGDVRQMKHRVKTYLHNTQRQPQIVRNYFQATDVEYAAA